MSDRELMQMALDALDIACRKYGEVGNINTDWGQWDSAMTALRARLAQPEPVNKFNPDWDAMAVMVEEQQRMAKEIEYLRYELVDQKAKFLDAEETLTEEGWSWDGDQWQRPAQPEPYKQPEDNRLLMQAYRAIHNKQPEPEPVAWISHNAGLYHGKPDESLNPLPLYTAPPQREWVGLTNEEMFRLWVKCPAETESRFEFARAVEAKLKEKNNG